MEAAKVKVPSGKISDNTLYHMDDVDLMKKTRHLMQLKEDLQNQIDQKTLEADGWLQVLGSSSAGEIDELASSLPFVAPLTSEQTILLREYHRLSSEMNAHSFLESHAAYITDEGHLLIKFVRPTFTSRFPTLLISLDASDDSTYSVRHHNLPKTIPVAECEEDYLKEVSATDDKNEKAKRFITAITQYTRALYSRQEQVATLEKSEWLNNTHVYHNSGCTVLCFLIKIKESGDEEQTFEFTLCYDPLDILPYKVEVNHMDEQAPTSYVMEIMTDMLLEMKNVPFPQVVYAKLTGNQASGSTTQSGSTETTSSQEETSSQDTTVFNFKN